jgi:hypothetical protein
MAEGRIPGYPRRCGYATAEEWVSNSTPVVGGGIGRVAAVNAVPPVISEVKTDRHTTCGWRTAE